MSLQIWMTKPSYIAFQMAAGGLYNAALESKVLQLPLAVAEPAWLWDSFPEERNRKGTKSGLPCCSHETKLTRDLVPGLILANYWSLEHASTVWWEGRQTVKRKATGQMPSIPYLTCWVARFIIKLLFRFVSDLSNLTKISTKNKTSNAFHT